jgi:hypothetical protein
MIRNGFSTTLVPPTLGTRERGLELGQQQQVSSSRARTASSNACPNAASVVTTTICTACTCTVKVGWGLGLPWIGRASRVPRSARPRAAGWLECHAHARMLPTQPQVSKDLFSSFQNAKSF